MEIKEFNKLVRRIKEEPSVLFLGQDYLKAVTYLWKRSEVAETAGSQTVVTVVYGKTLARIRRWVRNP